MNLLPQISGSGCVDLRTPAIRTIFQADSSHFPPGMLPSYSWLGCGCPPLGFSSFSLTGAQTKFYETLRSSLYCRSSKPHAQSETQENYMAHLALQEVIDRINQVHSPTKDQPTRNDRAKEQEHRPEVYIPRITRRLARVIFGT